MLKPAVESTAPGMSNEPGCGIAALWDVVDAEE